MSQVKNDLQEETEGFQENNFCSKRKVSKISEFHIYHTCGLECKEKHPNV